MATIPTYFHDIDQVWMRDMEITWMRDMEITWNVIKIMSISNWFKFNLMRSRYKFLTQTKNEKFYTFRNNHQ